MIYWLHTNMLEFMNFDENMELKKNKKSVRRSGTAAVKLLHSNFVAMYHVIITIYGCMIFIQVTLFDRDERKNMTK